MPNHSSPHHRETLRKTPSLFFALVGFFVFLALIPTLWLELDLQAAALFTGDAPKIAVKHDQSVCTTGISNHGFYIVGALAGCKLEVAVVALAIAAGIYRTFGPFGAWLAR